MSTKIAVIPGDEIGPEITAATLRCLVAIRATIVAADRVTPDLGGHGDTMFITDAIIDRLRG